MGNVRRAWRFPQKLIASLFEAAWRKMCADRRCKGLEGVRTVIVKATWRGSLLGVERAWRHKQDKHWTLI
jgi:hypothetical protein